MSTLFHDIRAAGIPHANHASDLYLPDSSEVRAILARYPLEESNARRFTNQSPAHEGERWIDVPFAFLPWWEARASRRAGPDV